MNKFRSRIPTLILGLAILNWLRSLGLSFFQASLLVTVGLLTLLLLATFSKRDDGTNDLF